MDGKVEREGRRLLILSEGVMMYWEEAEVQNSFRFWQKGSMSWRRISTFCIKDSCTGRPAMTY